MQDDTDDDDSDDTDDDTDDNNMDGDIVWEDMLHPGREITISDTPYSSDDIVCHTKSNGDTTDADQGGCYQGPLSGSSEFGDEPENTSVVNPNIEWNNCPLLQDLSESDPNVTGYRLIKDEPGLTDDGTSKSGDGTLGENNNVVTLRELKAPSGYSTDGNTIFTFETDGETAIEDGEPTLVDPDTGKIPVFVNAPHYLELGIQKQDSETNESEPQGDVTFENTKIEIVANFAGSGKITTEGLKNYTDTSKNGATGFDFSNGDVVFRGSADASGHILTGAGLPLLEDSSYTVTETRPAVGNTTDGTITFTWRLTDDIISSATGDVTVELLDKGESILNRPIRGGFEVQKQDGETKNDSALGGSSFNNIHYVVINKSQHKVLVNGVKYDPGYVCYEFWTDKNGAHKTTDGLLPYGRYLLAEVIKKDANSSEGVGDKTSYLGMSEADARAAGNEDDKRLDIASENGYNKDGSSFTDGADHPSAPEREFMITKDYELEFVNEGEWGGSNNSDYTYIKVKLTEADADSKNNNLVIGDHGSEGAAYQFGAPFNWVMRGDITFRKISALEQDGLCYIPFKITNNTTGESHIIMTDKNGYYTSVAKNYDYNMTTTAPRAHSHDTNWHDSNGYSENVYKEYTDDDGEDKNGYFDDYLPNKRGKVIDGDNEEDAGTWFGQAQDGTMADVCDDLPAFPYGDYTIEELPCFENRDYRLFKGTFSIYHPRQILNLGNIENFPNTGSLSSLASGDIMDSNDSHYCWATTDTRIVDVVTYHDLPLYYQQNGQRKRYKFRLHGWLVDAETEEPIEIDGKKIESNVSFGGNQTPVSDPTGEVKQFFGPFDSTTLKNKNVVIYELPV